MHLKVLALDYDGTIGDERGVSPRVREAIARARRAGIVVLIVTGRILGDLRRVAGDLGFVDAVVAENGGVLAFPGSGRSTVLAPAAPDAFVAALKQRGVDAAAGETVVEAEASAASQALDVIRSEELPLVLLFNRSRMMVLPQSVSKATGLLAALDALRLSPHNAVGVGDAENDHELLRACEVGVAVGWGSPSLQKMADEVLSGDGPEHVGAFIDGLLAESGPGPTLRIRRPRRRAMLGVTASGSVVTLAVTGRNVLVAGDPRSGKSWVAGLLCEQLILHGYSVCVIDPEGDYTSLEALPGVTIVGGEDPAPKPRDLFKLLRHPDRSLVIDLSRMAPAQKIDYLQGVLPQIRAVRRRTGLPHRVLVDEAHYFLKDADAASRLDLEGGGYTIVTYLAGQLHPQVRRAADVVLVSRAGGPEEVAALAEAAGMPERAGEWAPVLRDLPLGEAALLPGTEEAAGRLRRFRLVERLTPHIRHRMKYLDVPVQESYAFVFTGNGDPAGERVRTLKEFLEVLGRTSAERLRGHLRKCDFSRWIADVFGDRPLAARIQHLEEAWRLGRLPDVNDAIAEAVRERYELPELEDPHAGGAEA